MHLTLKSAAGLAAVAGLALVAGAASAQVTITKYAGLQTDNGSNILFTGPTTTFTEPSNFFDTRQNTITLFNSGTNYSGSEAFGLDVKGSFTITKNRTFEFTQGSDDGSYSFLTGPGFSNTSLIALPGPRNFSEKTVTETLAPGTYNYEVQYSESNGAPGALRFRTPPAVPEPSSVASMGLGAVGLLGLLLRARKVKRVSA